MIHPFARLACAVTFAFVLLAGCSPTKMEYIAVSMNADEIMRALDRRNRDVRSLVGIGQVSVDTPELSNLGTLSVSVLKPDSLLVEITGPFGVGVAKGLVTRAQFQFYNGIDNRFYTGTTNARNLRAILRMSIEFDDVIELLTGCIRFTHHDTTARGTATWNGSECTLRFATEFETVDYVIDADYDCVTRYTKKNTDGEILEEVKFKDFKARGEFSIPRVVSIERPPFQQSMTVLYETMKINDMPIDFTFKVPANVTHILLD